jgi:hypothetical protein
MCSASKASGTSCCDGIGRDQAACAQRRSQIRTWSWPELNWLSVAACTSQGLAGSGPGHVERCARIFAWRSSADRVPQLDRQGSAEISQAGHERWHSVRPEACGLADIEALPVLGPAKIGLRHDRCRVGNAPDAGEYEPGEEDGSRKSAAR